MNDQREPLLKRIRARRQGHAHRWQSRRARRSLAGLLATAELVMLAASLATPALGNITEPYVIGAGCAAILTWFLLRGVTRDISERYRGLDEWERALRNRGTRVGFQVGSIALVVLTLYLLAMLGPGHPARHTIDGVVLFAVSLAMLTNTVPALLLGWTLPNDDTQDLADPTKLSRHPA
jgi:hypothetical protein